jgi:hypothetical protein
MTGESTNSQKLLLATAIAQGTSIAQWARNNGVPERTAYYWAADSEVRSEVESIRRRALDEAVGEMANRARWAVRGIIELGDSADTDSVRLRALRAVISDFIAVSKFAGLEERMTEIEGKLKALDGHASERLLPGPSGPT